MKTFDTSWKLFAVVLASVVGMPVYAQKDALMQAIDRNGDGALQQDEIDLAVAALRGLDRDKNGTVSADELSASPAGRAGMRPDRRPEGREGIMRRSDRPDAGAAGLGDRGQQMLKQIDRDGDGKISKEEAPERLKERFDMIDTNKDGLLDKAEQEVLAQRMRERFKQAGQNRQSPYSRGGEPAAGGAPPKRPAPIE